MFGVNWFDPPVKRTLWGVGLPYLAIGINKSRFSTPSSRSTFSCTYSKYLKYLKYVLASPYLKPTDLREYESVGLLGVGTAVDHLSSVHCALQLNNMNNIN